MCLEIKKLNEVQTRKVYDIWIHTHFPEDEIKPWSVIQRMWSQEKYIAYGLFQKNGNSLSLDHLTGYAFFAKDALSNLILLDYFAMKEEYRRQGMGAYFLGGLCKELKEYHGILIETEDVSFAANETEEKIRKKRDRFYMQNHAVCTPIRSEVYGVHYRIWCLPITELSHHALCQSALSRIYYDTFPADRFQIRWDEEV